jgi:hypothetical protein
LVNIILTIDEATNEKLTTLYNTLLNTTSDHISFEEVEKKLNVSIDDVELLLYEGHNKKLFQLSIDYERRMIKIKYIKRTSYSKEQITSLRGKVAGLREKLMKVYNSIDNIKI